ncbi:MAG: hypothetical protein PHR06_08345 [Candidatus Cloacimonetes bacterium]|nr:hypothetical protein [Candidatus Cloacimonadota bacterium]
MKQKLILFLVLIITSLSAVPLNNIQTKDMNLIYYHNAHDYIIPHLSRSYIRTWNYYQNFWNYKPYEKSSVFIEDFSDWSNGGATAVPNNFIFISMSPYMYVYEVAPAAERMSLLMHHELVHVMAMDMSTKRDNFFRKIFFSKIQHTADNPVTFLYAYLTSPRKYAPRWYHEGIAVSMETWMGGGIGRAMGAYDEMVFRAMVRDNSKIYKMVGLEAEGTAIDFQVGANSYLYGTRFFGYLAHQYGPNKLIDWVKRDKKSKAYFSAQFEKVYKKNLEEEWDNWIDFENNFQEANLNRIRQNPITEFSPLTSQAMGSVSRSYLDKNKEKLFVGIKYPGQLPHIAEIDLKTGKKRRICNIKGAGTYFTTSLVYLPESEQLIYTTDNFYRRDLNIVDIHTKKSRLLIKDIRAGELALNKADNSIWGVRHENGISTLIKMKPPYKEWTAVQAFPFGTDLYDLDISPDGKLITASITRIDGNQKLIYFYIDILENGIFSENLIYDFDYSSPANFVFDESGRYLYGTSYYSGVSNVYRYDFEENDIVILSNCETGYFRPLPVNNDSLLVYNYVGGKGWQPGFIKNKPIENVSAISFLGQEVYEKFPYIKEWSDGSPSKIDLNSEITYQGHYSFLKNISNKGSYPIVEGYKDYVSYGYMINFSDDLGFHRFNLSGSYSPEGELMTELERLHLNLSYSYRDATLFYRLNRADFYDLFGPTKISHKGYSIGLNYNKNLVYDQPRSMDISLEVATHGDLETLPQYQNVISSYDKMSTASLSWKYSYIQNSLGYVDEESGHKSSINISSSYINEDFFPKVNCNLDFGFLLPVNHTSLWIRNSAGYAFGERNNSFANYYFGGFGNNWIDKRDEKRYRNFDSFPGFEINEIAGKSFVKNIAELNLPPLRFSEIGNTAIYMRWIRMSVFASLLNTDPDKSTYKTYYYNVGAQLDLKTVTLSFLETTLSVGFAKVWDEDKNQKNEFMLSLKVL